MTIEKNMTAKLSLIFLIINSIIITLLFTPLASHANSPFAPDTKYNFHGPNIGVGGFYSHSFSEKEQVSKGEYWLEVGYSYSRFVRFLSINSGMHQDFTQKKTRKFYSLL